MSIARSKPRFRWTPKRFLGVLCVTGVLGMLTAPASAHDGDEPVDEPGPAIQVENAVPGGPADQAGVQQGDVFLALNGHQLSSYEVFEKQVSTLKAGDTVTLTVGRDGKSQDLSLKLGTRSDGGPSFGVQLAVSVGTTSTEGMERCLGQIQERYQIEHWIQELDLDLRAFHDETLGCTRRDTLRMTPENAVRYCENIFKVHCPGTDLLTEIGDALVERCRRDLAESTGRDLSADKSWTTCAQHRLFDTYMQKGGDMDLDVCRDAWQACSE